MIRQLSLNDKSNYRHSIKNEVINHILLFDLMTHIIINQTLIQTKFLKCESIYTKMTSNIHQR